MRIKVSGDSMYPIICEADEIIVKRDVLYNIGDVLVFFFNRHLLVHRLLKEKNGFYYCKGDNAFRLETIRKKDIVGKVIKVIRDNIELTPERRDKSFIDMSYKISRIFLRNYFDVEKTKLSEDYREYYKKYLSLE